MEGVEAVGIERPPRQAVAHAEGAEDAGEEAAGATVADVVDADVELVLRPWWWRRKTWALPPARSWRSTTSTLRPWVARQAAAVSPPGPDPYHHDVPLLVPVLLHAALPCPA